MVQGQITESSESQDCRFEKLSIKQDVKGKERAEPWERQYLEFLSVTVWGWRMKGLSAGKAAVLQCIPKAARWDWETGGIEDG